MLAVGMTSPSHVGSMLKLGPPLPQASFVLCSTLVQAWFPGFGALMGSKLFCSREFLFDGTCN